MPPRCHQRLYKLQTVGALGGLIVPVSAFYTLLHGEATGRLPLFLVGEVGVFLFVGLVVLACWIWGQGAELS
jgi:hypothetical protein